MTDSPTADDGLADDEPAAVYPLLNDSGNQRVLREWLADHDGYVVVEGPLAESTFDLCIVDQPGLDAHSEAIRAAKTAAKPALLPVLLLVSDLESQLLGTPQSRLSDTVFETTVDELLSVPIRQAELEWRLQALVRLRDQSLNLQTQTDQLRKFKQAVEASGHAILMSDTDGTIEYVNPAFESMTGYSREKAVGESTELLHSGEMTESYYEELWGTITDGDTWREEITNQREDGSQYIADQTIAPIVENGKPTAFVAVQTDITERKALENRLSLHRDIVERLEDPIMIQTVDGNFRLVNDALCSFAGLTREELLSDDEYEFMDPETATTIARNKQRVIETEQPIEYSVEPTFEYSDREAVFYTSRYPYYEGGELAGTLAICRNVTDLEERTRQLHVLDNILRHNIRNNLNVIHGRGEQLKAGVDGELEAAADVIVKRAEDLLTTSEKSRAITAALSESTGTAPVELGTLLRDVATKTATQWPDVDIEVRGPSQLSVAATSTLEPALEELFTNAVIHNDSEKPQLHATLSVDDGQAILSIRDNGPGISAFDTEVLESGEAIDVLSHGSGLGLWLVYWTIKRSGGGIQVDDCEPRGTEIRIQLPQTVE